MSLAACNPAFQTRSERAIGRIWLRDIRFVSACKIPPPNYFESASPLLSQFDEIENGHCCIKPTRIARALAWFLEFLKEELAPVPGRAGIVARMVIAATLVMIIARPFVSFTPLRVRFTHSSFSRESPRATLQSTGVALLFAGVGGAYVLISAGLVINVPILHFLWVIGSFFLAFYALSAMTNYGAASTFALVIAVGIPIWERHIAAETNVEDTLWLTLAVSVGALVTAAIELASVRVNPGDDILLPVAERLSAVESLLDCYAEGRPTDASKKKVIRFGMLGTSSLRRLLHRSGYSIQYRAQMSGVVALVGRLVDITATLTGLSFEPTGTDAEQLRNLGMASRLFAPAY
jgi:multidrug resistance protein MdtO